MPTWTIHAADTGAVSLKTRDPIRGFTAGDPRAIERTITGVPAGRRVTAVIVLVKRTRTTADRAALFTKIIGPAARAGVGQILDTGAGGRAKVRIDLTAAETAPLARPAVYSAKAVLDSGEVYTVAEDTILGTPTLSPGVVVPVARVRVDPPSRTLRPDSIADFSATAFAEDGTLLVGRAVVWTLSDSRYAEITETGRLTVFALPAVEGTPAASFSVAVIATVDDQSAAATVTVEEPSIVVPPPPGTGGTTIGALFLALRKTAGSPN